MAYTIQLRRDTAANWALNSPVLAQGEAGIETDTGKAKLGNGTTTWTLLPYWDPARVTAAIQAEAARAQAAEAGLASASALAAETARAEAAESAPSAALTAEITRAQAAEALAAQKAANLSDLASATAARTNLGLGSAATQPSSAFDAAGSATAAAGAETTRAEAAEAGALQKANNLTDLTSASGARTSLGLGSAAVQPASAFDTSGAAAAAQSAAQSFATSSVATETTRAEAAEGLALAKAQNLADLASAGTARANLGLGTAATQASTAFDAAGAAAAAAAASVPVSSLPLAVTSGGTGAASAGAALTALGGATAASVTAETARATTAEGLAAQKPANLSDLANAGTARTNLGLGTSAVQPSSAFDAAGSAGTAQTAAQTFATGAVATETTRATAAEALAAQKSANLSDLASASTARANLGLGSAAVQPSTAFDASGLAAAEATRAQAAEALLSPLAITVTTAPAPSGDVTGATDTARLAAIFAGFAAAGSGWLNLRAGIYYVNASLSVPSNVRVTGAGMWLTTVWMKGVTFEVSGTYYNLFATVSGAVNVEFRDFWITGDNNPMQVIPNTGVNSAGICTQGAYSGGETGGSGFRCERVGTSYIYGIGIQMPDTTTANVEIIDCWAYYNACDGFNPNSTGLKLTGCTMIGNGYSGCETAGINITVADNYVTLNQSQGISLVGANASASYRPNNRIHDNVCLGNSSAGINVSGSMTQFDIHDNVCRNNGRQGIAVETAGSQTPFNGKIHHNMCVSNSLSSYVGYGIFVNGNTVEVDSNYVTDTADSGYAQFYGIGVYGTASCRVTNNHSLGNISKDYYFYSAASMVVTITDPGAVIQYAGTGTGITAGHLTCTGTPLSVVPAAVGVLCQRTDGGGGTTLYVKETASGSTDTAGWVPYASVATVTAETTRATTAEGLLAPKASPALTGVPTAPTAAPLTGSTQLATTAYTDAAAAAVAGGTSLLKANNLSDLASVATALANLGVTAPNVQMFTATGTWTKPANAKTVFTAVLPGGTGAGSGASGTSGTALTGGGGGAAGIVCTRQFAASDLTSTVAVTVGLAGAGGASVTGMSSPRVDTGLGGTTISSAAVTDTAAVAGDVGRSVSGAGIPANAYIVSLAGTTYTISANATATASSVTLTIGTHTVGLPGATGGISSFGTYMRSPQGTAGGGGSIAVAGAAGGAPSSTPGGQVYGSGAASSATGGAGGALGAIPLFGPPGGVSGGGITAAGAASNGSGGTVTYYSYDAAAGTGGVAGGASPTSGTASAITNGACGAGPGSGAASITGTAQGGANALAGSGAGGAGGGASLNGNASGAGGNGGSGWVLVITYFQ
jgi:trimeric autotransporter adhesin